MEFIPNKDLQELNWFKTGGRARWFCRPASTEDMQEALAYAQEEELETVVLGEGANILISDDGVNGLVIQPANAFCDIQQDSEEEELVLLQAGAGTSFQTVIDFAMKHNLLGLEEFSGIPGSVGGAVYINIHYFEYLLSEYLVSAHVMERESGTVHEAGNSWFGFGYDRSRLHRREHILIDATFRMRKGSELESAYAWGRRDEIIRHRERRYPREGTCGSFFQNFSPEEVTLEEQGRKVTAVAWYLDKLGIKGSLAVGDAIVSHKHANMIVNRGRATATEIITLARLMQEKVRDAFGLVPQPECQLTGFKEYPLLTP